MKTSLIFTFIIVQSILMLAQKQPESFILKIPDLPMSPCTIDYEEREVFLSKLSELEDELRSEIEPRKEKIEIAYKNSKPQFEKQVMQESGLSQSDIQKLKNKKLSKEEKKKIADKMIQEKTNMSLQEIENLKKMSKEGKEAWAEAYTTEQMATMEGKTDSLNIVNQKNMNLYELAKEQSELAQLVAAEGQKFINKFYELDQLDSTASDLLVRRDSIMASMGKEDGKEYENKVNEIRRLELSYCQTMTPDYFAILNDHLISLKSMQATYFKLEKVNAELNEATLKIKNPDFYSPGLMGLEAVRSHINLLQDAFKYAKYTFPVSKNKE